MAFLATLGIILHGIGVAIGKTWDATRDFVSWLFSVMPGPLKFFFFLYMIVFILSSIMPVFLGAGNSCDSFGNAYKINFVTLQSKINYVDNMAEICSGSYNADVTFTGFLEASSNPVGIWEKTFYIIKNVWSVWSSWKSGNYDTLDPVCGEFNSLNFTNTTLTRDVVLREWGERISQDSYENIVHIGCSRNRDGEYFPSLNFYNVDLFNFEMWLLIGVAGLLIPFAFKWYRMVLKR